MTMTMNKIPSLRINEYGKMRLFSDGAIKNIEHKIATPKIKVNDIVFKRSDLKKELPIRITSIMEKREKFFYYGSHTNRYGKMVSNKYKEDELKPAK